MVGAIAISVLSRGAFRPLAVAWEIARLMVRMGVGDHGEDLGECEFPRSRQNTLPAIRAARDHGESL